MKIDYSKMSKKELLNYCMQNRADEEAWGVYLDRRSPDSEATWYTLTGTDEEAAIATEAMLNKIKEIDSRNSVPD